MALVGLGIVTIAFFVGLFKVTHEAQKDWLIRGFLLFVLIEMGLSLNHIISFGNTITKGITTIV